MKILVIADIHGESGILREVLEHASPHNPDLIICPGNLTDMFKVPPEFSQIDMVDLIVQKLLSLRKPVLCVPGNHDPYETLDIFDDYKINLHNMSKKLPPFTFIGFGGAQTPFNTLFEPSDEEIKHHLAKLPATPPFILVTHNPPKDTKLDQLPSSQHVGSPAIREYILQKKPLLAISAHIHEGAGEDVLGGTVLFNPGPALFGNYGLVTIENGRVTCEIHKVPKIKPSPV